ETGSGGTSMSGSWNWVLIVAGAVLVLVEVAFGGFAGFDLVLIGSAFVIGGCPGLGLPSPVSGSLGARALGGPFIPTRAPWVRGERVASNVDALVGKQGLVIQRVAPHAPGQVKVSDEVWRAEPAPDAAGPFEPGALVTVAGVHGVTLQVR